MRIKCPLCEYTTEDAATSVVTALLTIHATSHAPTQTHTPNPNQPKLERPRISLGVEEEQWNNFIRKWDAFKIGSAIEEPHGSGQLLQCCSDDLSDIVLKSDAHVYEKDIETVKSLIKSFAVIPVAIGVRRAELMQLRQAPDELFRSFAAKTKGKAETCKFRTMIKCECDKYIEADYTNDTVRDVLLAGIADVDIRREALSLPNVQKMTINDVIAFVETREMAIAATPAENSLSAVSSFKRIRKDENSAKTLTNRPEKRSPQLMTCPTCKTKFPPFKQRRNGTWNTTPFKSCVECWRSERQKPMLSSLNVGALMDEPITQLSAISTRQKSKPETIHIDNLICKNDLKSCIKKKDHPRVQLIVENKLAEHNPGRKSKVLAVADSGAMSNIWGFNEFIGAGFDKSELLPVSIDIKAANHINLKIMGYFNAKITGESGNGKHISSYDRIYVSSSITDFYLSYESMLNLGILDAAFPSVGQFSQRQESDPAMQASLSSGKLCKCPQIRSVPPKPDRLPFSPVPENNDKMKEWLLDTFKSSTFNTCPHCPLPTMTGPPIEIHVDESAKPKTCHTAAPVALHWQNQVHQDLLRDEALGVIEKVPYGEPVTWCHRMVITRKHDGTPRRTVDLSPLNKFCRRETFSAESPFPMARRIPGNTWKTVMDAWNGYHSIPLRESDRHLTTFITPFGRWRYTRAPQGYLSSGDGYNRRFDSVLADFQRKERCVDDTIFYDNDLESHWWRTIEFLRICGHAGIILNPKKFQFAKKDVEFAGFRITEGKICPLPKYIEAIKAFPTPTSTTDIRSWFGLINRVANYAKLRDAMELFRPFLSPKYKFFWSDVLNKAFEESKRHIVDAILEGVEIFDVTKPTCLRPDWSKKGIGYWLLQKHCKCQSELPDCCDNGWRITLAGSRFLKGPELRYAPIEGEALAIVWGLEQTEYFTQGCPKLVVVTDHKPLTKIFGDRTLDEISNSRLFRLKQKTLPWYFEIHHMPGKSNCAADAMSRYPVGELNDTEGETQTEELLLAGICRDVTNVSTISWTQIETETSKDKDLSAVISYLEDGKLNAKPNNELRKYLDSLYTLDGVIMYQDRVIIPKSLRSTTLSNLHAAHQGVTAMVKRASSIMFWPKMMEDIQQVRAKCTECNTNAPSQSQLPSTPAIPPSFPFEQIFADFFDYAGHHFLIIGDRLSGWPEIYSTPKGSEYAGSKGLVACLRKCFATFGVPTEISSDGGPEFTASNTKTFLDRWGVNHRKSSAYHPQSNGRAEVAVKSAKRLLRSNISPSGSLDSDRLLRGLLQLRNTPDPDCNVSPAQIVFGKPLKDAFSFINRLDMFKNQATNPVWREAWQLKEKALRARFVRTSEKLNMHCRDLKKLDVGDRCFIQNQTGPSPKRWDRTGIVMEINPHNQYSVRVDGSRRLTTRNRRFLRYFQPADDMIQPTTPPLKRNNIETEHLDQNQESVSNEDIRFKHITQTPSDSQFHQGEDGNDIISHFPIQTGEKVSKLPSAIKRLQPHNSEGLKEESRDAAGGGRKTRSKSIIHN